MSKKHDNIIPIYELEEKLTFLAQKSPNAHEIGGHKSINSLAALLGIPQTTFKDKIKKPECGLKLSEQEDLANKLSFSTSWEEWRDRSFHSNSGRERKDTAIAFEARYTEHSAGILASESSPGPRLKVERVPSKNNEYKDFATVELFTRQNSIALPWELQIVLLCREMEVKCEQSKLAGEIKLKEVAVYLDVGEVAQVDKSNRLGLEKPYLITNKNCSCEVDCRGKTEAPKWLFSATSEYLWTVNSDDVYCTISQLEPDTIITANLQVELKNTSFEWNKEVNLLNDPAKNAILKRIFTKHLSEDGIVDLNDHSLKFIAEEQDNAE